MGLEEHISNGTGVIFLMYLGITRSRDEAIARPFIQELSDSLNDYAISIAANWDWPYLNYANRTQHPIAKFGEAQIEKIQAASAKYDPDCVLQKLRRSGFKIPTVAEVGKVEATA
jgi:hypothetical protein